MDIGNKIRRIRSALNNGEYGGQEYLEAILFLPTLEQHTLCSHILPVPEWMIDEIDHLYEAATNDDYHKKIHEQALREGA